jgi:hypothetical protein
MWAIPMLFNQTLRLLPGLARCCQQVKRGMYDHAAAPSADQNHG